MTKDYIVLLFIGYVFLNFLKLIMSRPMRLVQIKKNCVNF